MDIFKEIRIQRDGMRKSEQKVADLVFASPDFVMNASITDVSKRAGVSDPTVIRFCKKIGLKGVSELKLKLAASKPVMDAILEDITPSDSIETIFTNIMGSVSEAVSNMDRGMDRALLDKAVNILAGAKRWEFYGMGGSGVVAHDAHHKFFRLGVPCVAYADSHMQVMSATQLDESAVVVVISHSGATKDIIESAEIARASGAKVLGILGKKASPLASHCDIPLCVSSREVALRLAPMVGRLMQLAVLDVLFVGVAMRLLGKTGFSRLDKVKRALHSKIV
ncbi:MurR/RpiR family transcriptional regulator [Desulfospira joergensenii]|uniref:MurR/RpiR family transcriptional regulator n=1 Tax=Desulfospira joergensenii TaxID=53329 RepID=UPI0003B4E5A5|nr:MurR/RpiR family transcriptional regulator [Desulfospira joergensenii]